MEKSVTYSPVNTVSVMTGIKPGLQTLVREKKIFDEISAPQKKKKKKDLIQHTFKLHSFTFNINIKVKRQFVKVTKSFSLIWNLWDSY